MVNYQLLINKFSYKCDNLSLLIKSVRFGVYTPLYTYIAVKLPVVVVVFLILIFFFLSFVRFPHRDENERFIRLHSEIN